MRFAGIHRSRRTAPLPASLQRGEAPGSLPPGGGMGKPGFPISQPLVGAAGAPLAGVRFDRLTAGGKPGFPISQPLVGAAGAPHREGDGETWFPHIFTSDGHAHGAQRRDDHGVSLGERRPPKPSPRGGLPGRGQGRGAAAPLRPNPPARGLCSPQSQAHLAHSFIRFPFVGPFPPPASREAHSRTGETR